MDNNQTSQVTPQPNPSIIQQPQSSGGNKIVLWLIITLVVIVLAGGAYWYFVMQKGSPVSQTAPTTGQTVLPQSNLENDLDAIDVQASDDAEFNNVDSDLQNL